MESSFILDVSTHILNLIDQDGLKVARDGLKVASDALHKIR